MKNILFRIEYTYHEVYHNHLERNPMHEIDPEEVSEYIIQKDYLLYKQDILYLLRNDGCTFFADSLRVYDPELNNYFQVTDDSEFDIQLLKESGVTFLSFWVKPEAENLHRRVEDMEESFQQDINAMKEDITKLRSYSQILFNQLVKIYQNQQQAPEDIPFLTSEQSTSLVLDSSAPKNIDIALMYADPLVKESRDGLISLGDAVDYEGECNRIVEMFKAQNKNLNIYFEIATISGLVNTLSLSPTILHIICHGEFDQEKGKFYLCFEDEGKLVRLYSEDLKKILSEINVKTKMIFVNACHSEEVAQVFYEAGAPCVIAIQSELKIEDTIAQKFSTNLYWQLLEGKTIIEAFKNSKAAINGKDVHTCCCAHKHKKNCLWYKYAKENGFEEAHMRHTPTCTECKFDDKLEHNIKCQWANNFLFDTLERFDDDHEENSNLHVCCCSPELTHNEAMKFKLICSDKSSESQVLFHKREKGEVSIKSSFSCVEQKYPVQRFLGRNPELYEVYKALAEKSKRFVNIHGPESIGKLSLAKRAANYLYERGFFGDKISIIMLERTPSKEHFRADLIKEIPGVGTWEKFIEVIKYSKILFILVQCEHAINNYKQEFIQDLATIARSAINVKFLLLTEHKVAFSIGEVEVEMRDLKKVDAARLLIEYASSSLDISERNPYDLKDNPIFDLIPLTPKNIWLITQKLRNRNLKRIANEFEDQRNRPPTDTGESEEQASVKSALNEIKKSNLEAYNLVIFMSMFPAGLAYHNLNELANQQKIPRNWKWIVLSLLEPLRYKDLVAGRGDIQELDKTYFRPNNYIWMNVERDRSTHEIYFKPPQFLPRDINKNFELDFVPQIIKKLEYMTIISLEMIDKVKANNIYNEKLAEFSAISHYSIWKPLKEEEEDLKLYAKHHHHHKHDLTASDAKRHFNSQLENFLSCFEVSTMKNILQCSPAQEQHLSRVLNIFCLAVPTLFKIMNPEEHILKDYNIEHDIIVNIFKILEVFPASNPKIHLIKIKINLFLAALYMRTKDNYSIANLKIENASNLATGLPNPAIKAEIAFAKAIHFFRNPKRGLIHKESYNPSLFYKELKGKLTEAKDSLKPLMNDENYAPLIAKLTLLICKAVRRYDEANIELDLMKNMKISYTIFEKFRMPRLLMKTLYMYACLKLELEKNKQNGTSNTLSESKTIKQDLVRVKHVYLVNGALKISQRIKDKSYESRINSKIEEFNMEIRRAYFNVIILMRAAPIVELKPVLQPSKNRGENNQIVHELVTTNIPTRMISTFKGDLGKVIEDSKKVVYTKFEILTKEKLTDCLTNGCRILFLACHCTEPNYLCVEGEYSKLEKIPYVEIRDIFTSKPIQMSSSSSENQKIQEENKLDLLILGNKNDMGLAELFVDLNIPHIITFEFSNKDKDFFFNRIEEECINKFTALFFHEIINKKTVAKAFDKAYKDTFEYLTNFYFDNKKQDKLYAQKIIGQGPILLPSETSHDEALFNNQELSLETGTGEDISSTKCPTNISRFTVPYTGRNREIFNFMKKVCESRGFLKITGGSGSGKTSFIRQVAYYIVTRNIFPDGVFYIPMKNLRHKALQDLFKETLGLDFQTEIRSFLAEKKMLLIFDDFDYLYNNNVEFPQHIFPLKDCRNITCIVITTAGKDQEESAHRRKEIEGNLLGRNAEWKLRPLPDEDLAYMIMSLIDSNKEYINSVNVQKVKEGAWMKRSQGNPAKLIRELREGGIVIDGRRLQINPVYEAALDLEQKYLEHNKALPKGIFELTGSSDVSQLPMIRNLKSAGSLHDHNRVHSSGAHGPSNFLKITHGKSPAKLPLRRDIKSHISPTASDKTPSSESFDRNAKKEKAHAGISRKKRGSLPGNTDSFNFLPAFHSETKLGDHSFSIPTIRISEARSEYGHDEEEEKAPHLTVLGEFDHLPSDVSEMHSGFAHWKNDEIMLNGEDFNATGNLVGIQEEEQQQEEHIMIEALSNMPIVTLVSSEESSSPEQMRSRITDEDNFESSNISLFKLCAQKRDSYSS